MVCCETYKFTERAHLDSICFNQLGISPLPLFPPPISPLPSPLPLFPPPISPPFSLVYIYHMYLGDPDELPATADLTSHATPHVPHKDKDKDALPPTSAPSSSSSSSSTTSSSIKDWRHCENLKLLNLLYDLTPIQCILFICFVLFIFIILFVFISFISFYLFYLLMHARHYHGNY